MNQSSSKQPSPRNQLDFWLGQWKVSFDDGKTGTNTITRKLSDHVIEENFDAQDSLGFSGISHSVYSEAKHKWLQTWVDSEGNYWAFEGGWFNDEFIFQTTDVHNHQTIQLRMVFSEIKKNSLNWKWQRSDDFGLTWSTKWEIEYQRIS